MASTQKRKPVEKKKKKKKRKMASGFSLVNEDILQNILKRLPAVSFSSAACVSKCWYNVCSTILSKPKLASALSLNPSLHIALKEVLDKVLSEPIRPHFAIACTATQFCLQETHQRITQALGPGIPIITSAANGVIGIDALTNELKEVKWDSDDDDDPIPEGYDFQSNLNRGVVLVVGFVPGLKVGAIPLLRLKKDPVPMVKKFVTDIKDYTASVSGGTSPVGIILFGDQSVDMKPILADLDYAMPEETVIVGDASSCFLIRSGENTQNYCGDEDLYMSDAAALVFARERNKSPDIGETQFHVTLSTGVLPFGPELKAVSVRMKGAECSWLLAEIEETNEILDGTRLLDDIIDMLDDESLDLYIGVTQQRKKSSLGSEKSKLEANLTFYEVMGGDSEYLVINGIGIKPGDSFIFYHSDHETASSSCGNVYKNLGFFSKDEKKGNISHHLSGVTNNNNNKEVFGGLIFSCCHRGESFFGLPNVDSQPFCKNFPRVPVAGVFCGGEIGRASSSLIIKEDDEEESPARCCLHVYSTVYLVMSIVPASSHP
ncbi:F-box domain-containing protein/FIST_C domain-containing protein [Cephalotus follicularis]|uniref:F-box domain-containing protein/FIST_C domain-containing protein n=1 Tax=Cephalotus follicularis TaxID=3775 RepID=A0A1Q3DJ51_CEPFO|nr:F-box domain-containing protein/FIST_C domain-containing protein [Cephalotus follicularis]